MPRIRPPTCSRPISPNAACCILSWAKLVPSAKLPQGVINKCNLHSNTKGRLKIPCGIFQTAFHFGYRLSNQSSPTSIVFSL